MSDNEVNDLADQASASLRQGIGRSRRLAQEARHRLSELTSPTVHPGPAEFILADTTAQAETDSLDQPSDEGQAPTA